MCDATVSLPPRQAPSTGAACSRRIAPGSRTRPSGSRIARSCATLNSSETPPSSSPTHVFERDQPRDPAVVVLDERVMAAPFAQERQQPIGGHGFADPHDRPEQGGNRGARPLADVVEHDILGVQDADHAIERAAIDRQAAVRAGRHEPQHVVERRRRRRAPRAARAAPSAAALCAGRGAAPGAGAPARAARAGRRRGSRRSAARSLPASGRGDGRSRRRPAA